LHATVAALLNNSEKFFVENKKRYKCPNASLKDAAKEAENPAQKFLHVKRPHNSGEFGIWPGELLFESKSSLSFPSNCRTVPRDRRASETSPHQSCGWRITVLLTRSRVVHCSSPPRPVSKAFVYAELRRHITGASRGKSR